MRGTAVPYSIINQMKALVNKTDILVVNGDITNENTDCIVNSANTNLTLVGELAEALRSKGRSKIQQECDEWVRREGPVPTGDCAFTRPGNLACKYIIHTVGPVYQDGRSREPELLRKALVNTYELARRLNSRSISIPALSCGVFKYPKEKVASICFSTTIDYLNHNETPLTTIRFINLDDTIFKAFQAEFRRHFPTNDFLQPLYPNSRRGSFDGSAAQLNTSVQSVSEEWKQDQPEPKHLSVKKQDPKKKSGLSYTKKAPPKIKIEEDNKSEKRSCNCCLVM